MTEPAKKKNVRAGNVAAQLLEEADFFVKGVETMRLEMMRGYPAIERNYESFVKGCSALASKLGESHPQCKLNHRGRLLADEEIPQDEWIELMVSYYIELRQEYENRQNEPEQKQ